MVLCFIAHNVVYTFGKCIDISDFQILQQHPVRISHARLMRIAVIDRVLRVQRCALAIGAGAGDGKRGTLGRIGQRRRMRIRFVIRRGDFHLLVRARSPDRVKDHNIAILAGKRINQSPIKVGRIGLILGRSPSEEHVQFAEVLICIQHSLRRAGQGLILHAARVGAGIGIKLDVIRIGAPLGVEEQCFFIRTISRKVRNFSNLQQRTRRIEIVLQLLLIGILNRAPSENGVARMCIVDGFNGIICFRRGNRIGRITSNRSSTFLEILIVVDLINSRCPLKIRVRPVILKATAGRRNVNGNGSVDLRIGHRSFQNSVTCHHVDGSIDRCVATLIRRRDRNVSTLDHHKVVQGRLFTSCCKAARAVSALDQTVDAQDRLGTALNIDRAALFGNGIVFNDRAEIIRRCIIIMVTPL